jgi:hypothetical protein
MKTLVNHAKDSQPLSLHSVADNTPPIVRPVDAEVDLDILKAVPKKFMVEDEKSANWLIKRIISARQYAASVKVWAELELRRAEREESTLMFLFGRQIEAWTKSEIERQKGRRKSLCLPGGKVGFRTDQTKLVIDSELAVLEWARLQCPAAIITVEHLSKSIVKEHFEKTGEVPESGAHIQPEQERFFVSVGG